MFLTLFVQFLLERVWNDIPKPDQHRGGWLRIDPHESLMVDCFKVSLSPADDERLSVSSSRQRVSLVTRQSLTRSEWVPCISFGSALPTQCISFGWEPFDRKSPKSNKTTQKPGIFGTMLSFTDGLVSSGSVWIRCFGVHCGKPKWDC